MVSAYATVDGAAHAAEAIEGKYGRRIVKVFCADEKLSDLWYGQYGNAPIEAGPNGYRFSDGEEVTL